MLQEELRCLLYGFQEISISCSSLILDKTPESRERFIDGRMVSLRVAVTIPAAVSPLPSYQRLSKLHDSRIVHEPQPVPDCQSVTLLGRAPPVPAVYHGNIAKMSLTKQPFQEELRCSDRGSESRRDSELYERDETPVSAGPFLIRVYSKTAISLLPVKQDADFRSANDQSSSLLNFERLLGLVQNFSEREIADRGILRPEKPFEC